MMEWLKKNLPASFRISASRVESQDLLKILQTEYFAELSSHHAAGEDVAIPKVLPLYPVSSASSGGRSGGRRSTSSCTTSLLVRQRVELSQDRRRFLCCPAWCWE